MTKSPEMPPEILFAKDGTIYNAIEGAPIKGDVSYIRRAVSKEEAGAALDYFNETCLGSDMDEIIRKALEAHK